MIIDSHAHLGYIGRFNATVDDLIRWADRAGIDKMVVSNAHSIWVDMRAGNDALGAAMRAHPHRILGYASFTSTYLGRAVSDEIDRCVETYGMQGLKIYSDRKRSVAEPHMFPILAHAAGLGLPILAHADAREVGILAEQVPEATILIAHLGEGFTDTNMWQTLHMARQQPNVIIDLTSSQVYAGMVEACVDAIGPERVVWGTDMPLLEPEVQLQKVYTAHISEKHRQMILAGNAMRLFKLAGRPEVTP